MNAAVATTGFKRHTGITLMPETALLETIKGRIKERLSAKGLSANSASRRAGLGLSYLNDLLTGKSRNPTRQNLAKLATILDCDVDYFYGEVDTPHRTEAMRAPDNDNRPRVYGIGMTDRDGFFLLDDANLIDIGAWYNGAPNSYAVTVPDDCMEPRYSAGEIVLANPMRPVSRGCCAVIRMTDDRALIREIVAISPDKITVKRSGGDPTEIKRDDIKAIHRIVASREA
jgi:transcriptional regulator with XRE-family HTH domain